MPDKFVRKPQFGVDDLLIINQDDVVESSAPSHSLLFKHLIILNKTKGSRWSDLLSEVLFTL